MDIFGSPALGVLGRASLQGALVIAAVWVAGKLFPRLPASLRCGLWWLACAKLVIALVWTAPVRLALLPASAPAAVAGAPRVLDPGASPGSSSTAARETGGSPRARPWESAALAIWVSGVLFLLGRTVQELRQAQGMVRRARPVEEPWLADLFSDLRARTGAPLRTGIRLSSEARTPQVSGLLRPVVLLPESAPARLSRAEMAMTLCHELLHVRRGDLWLGWIPALMQRLFFFHPLAYLAAREYALAREAACDADVLRVLNPVPATYGHLLVRLGVMPQAPKLGAAGAAPSYQILKRRLTMLQNASDKKRLHPAWWILAAFAAGVILVPFIITAQEAPQAGGEESYVLLLGKDTTIMSGAPPSTVQARKLQRSPDDQLFWFRHNGKGYVIRDAATLSQIKTLFEPQMRLGEEQAELGNEMTKLSDQQAAVGEEIQQDEQDSGSMKEKKVYFIEKGSDRPVEQAQDDSARQQEDLGRQQERLGQRQAEVARRAETQLRALVGQAIASGTAQEVR
jgi:beta-lactamase regulating signal transducer with metallopeptidase domain